MEPGPNYSLCSDPGDAEQLTDGVYTDGFFWVQKSTVGDQEKTPSTVTIDLGEVKPIRGVSYHTAAGFADVHWPQTIRILVAGENGEFHEIGDLVQLSEAQHGPLAPMRATDAMWALDEMVFSQAEVHFHYDKNRDRFPEQMTPEVRERVIKDAYKTRAEQYGTYRYWTDRLRTHGRYVSLVVWNEPYTFADEIEVYAGEPEWVDEPLPGRTFPDVKTYAVRLSIERGIRTRLTQDIEALRQMAEDGIPSRTQSAVLGELATVEASMGQATREFGNDFEAVLPLNSWHEQVLQTQARLWRARGFKPLTFWRSNLWDPLPLIGTPDTAAVLIAAAEPIAETELAVDVHLMRKEHRAAAFNVSNSSDESMQVAFRLSGLPGGDNPEYVTVHEVIWTDTRFGVPVAAALPEIAVDNGLYAVSVPSGMTRQVWLTFNPMDIEPGTYEGAVVVESTPGDERFPLRMHLVSPGFPGAADPAHGRV